MKKTWKSETWTKWRWHALSAVAILAMGAGCLTERNGGNNNYRPDVAEYQLSLAQSCDEVREHIAGPLTEQLLDYHYGYYYRGWDDFDSNQAQEDAAPEAGSGNDGGSDAPSEYTDTNVQEQGVDEPDFVKTDGTHIYTLAENSLQVLTSWPPEDTARVGRYDFPDGVYPRSMFLKGDLIAVFSQMWSGYYYYDEESRDGEDGALPAQQNFSGTRISLIDISDRSNPELIRQLDIEGSYVTGRMIDGRAYLVTNSGLRNLNVWSFYNQDIDGLPVRDYEETAEELEEMRDEARPIVYAHIRAALDDLEPEDFLPRQRIVDENNDVVLFGALHDCTDLYLPQVSAQLGILNISAFNLDIKTEIETTGLIANGWHVYASQQNLYVAMSSRSWWWWGWGNQENESHIHKFRLSPDERPEYRASGRVDGWILNQFSFSEYEGHLRVATTDNRWEHNPETGEFEDEGGNHIIIVKNEDGHLVETGSVRDLAPTERVYSARFAGDKGYVVTFRETDPFYTLDLSDPTNPQMIGELKIEGFSSYMHPLDENHLLAIGRDGDENGFMTGVHLQVFDVSDMSDPQRIHHYVISTGGWSSNSEAMWNHHAFTYQPRLGVLSIPMNIWENDERFTGLMLFDATVDGISEIGRVDHGDLAEEVWCIRYGQASGCQPDTWWTWWSNMRRSIIMSGEPGEEFVYSISSVGLKVNEVYDDQAELASVLWVE